MDVRCEKMQSVLRLILGELGELGIPVQIKPFSNDSYLPGYLVDQIKWALREEKS